MKRPHVLMTGGSGDLGMSLAPRLLSAGCSVTSLDPLPSSATEITSVQGSILDRPLLDDLMARADVVIHIAAWHGFHAFTKSKNDADFWDLNMTGTFNVLDACTRAKVTKCIFISSSSVDEWPEMYGTTKLLGEELCRSYVARAPMQILALRPRAFIPWWNTAVYNTIDEWAEWFIRGAVHIDDVAEACILGYNLLSDKTGAFFNNITLDGKRDLSDIELAQWRTRGGKEILATHFPRYRDLIMNGTFIPAEPPTYKGNSKAREILGYEPRYGLGEMLEELERLHSVKAA